MIGMGLILVFFVLSGGLAGCLQGMVMTQSIDNMSAGKTNLWEYGVRNHVWFGMYSKICFFGITAYTILVVLLLANMPESFGWQWIQYMMFFIGCSLLGVSSGECMYYGTRYGTLDHAMTRLDPFEIHLFNLPQKWSVETRIVRIICSVIFVFIGLHS